MTENIKAFLEKISADEELRKKAEALNELKDKDEAIAATIKLASDVDITLTEADFASQESEVSDDELDAVA
jgi:predicted ribosomally synthesized peptide with nif11-like leader